MKPSAMLNTRQAQVMHILKQNVHGFAEAHYLTLRFQTMLRYGHLHHLSQWITAAAKSEIYALQRCAKALRRDEDAIRNAIVALWSSGQVEGQINRPKTIKRSMYGRGGIGLLHARMLPLSNCIDHKLLINYQKNITAGMQTGNQRDVEWSVPDQRNSVWRVLPGMGAFVTPKS